MKSVSRWGASLLVVTVGWVGGASLRAQNPVAAGSRDPTAAPAFAIQMVTVAAGVELEVLDWGGTGRPVVLLAGLGATAHSFDAFASKLTDRCRVFGITRRGFGASTVTESGYSADELGDDVLAVIDFLGLERPVLIGHSIAGSELSSIGTRFPGRVAGLVYLEAGYAYAFYDEARGDLLLDALDTRRQLEQLLPGRGLADPGPVIRRLLDELPRLEQSLRATLEKLAEMPPRSPGAPVLPDPVQAIFAGQRKFTSIPVPTLAIYAVPHDLSRIFPHDAAARERAEAWDAENTGAQARAFEKGVPNARVVRISRGGHAVHQSNEQEVLREIRTFLDRLP